jgi:large subunit ribosomal protein L14
MIYTDTQLTVTDNSGAKRVKSIRVISNKNRDIGIVGSTLLVRVVKKKHAKKIKKKLLYYGLITMIKQLVKRSDGTIIKFNENRILLFTSSYKFLGSRVYGPLMREIRFRIYFNKKEKQKYLKVISYFTSII